MKSIFTQANRIIVFYTFPNPPSDHKAVFDVVTDVEKKTVHLLLVHMPTIHSIHAVFALNPKVFKEYLDEGYSLVVYEGRYSIGGIYDVAQRVNATGKEGIELDIRDRDETLYLPFVQETPTEEEADSNKSTYLRIYEEEDPVVILDQLKAASEKEWRFIATEFALEHAKRVRQSKAKKARR